MNLRRLPGKDHLSKWEKAERNLRRFRRMMRMIRRYSTPRPKIVPPLLEPWESGKILDHLS